MGARNKMAREREKRLEAQYRKWIAPMAHCVVSGVTDGVELIHIRRFTGMGIKPPPQQTLPLCRRFHEVQENDRTFFADIGILNATDEAEILFELFELNDSVGWVNRVLELADGVNKDAALSKLMRAA